MFHYVVMSFLGYNELTSLITKSRKKISIHIGSYRYALVWNDEGHINSPTIGPLKIIELYQLPTPTPSEIPNLQQPGDFHMKIKKRETTIHLFKDQNPSFTLIHSIHLGDLGH